MAARVTKIEGSLRDAKEWYKYTFDFVEENARQVEEYGKDAKA